MAIRVKHDMDPATVAATVQTAVRQESAERAAATRASRSVGTRAAAVPGAPRGARRNAQNVGSFVQPGSVAPPSADAPEGPNSLDELVVGEVFDGFNQYLAEFDKYEIDPADKAKFTSTWRAIVNDDSIDPDDKVMALQAVLQRGQRMIDASPQKRDKRAEFLMSLKDNPDPFVYDPDKGDLVENPYAGARIKERDARIKEERELRLQAADARKKETEAVRAQQAAERLEMEKRRVELTEQNQEFIQKFKQEKMEIEGKDDAQKAITQRRSFAADRLGRISTIASSQHRAAAATHNRATAAAEKAEKTRGDSAALAAGYQQQAEAAQAEIDRLAPMVESGKATKEDAEKLAAQRQALLANEAEAEKYRRQTQAADDAARKAETEATQALEAQLQYEEQLARIAAALAQLDMVETDKEVQRILAELNR